MANKTKVVHVAIEPDRYRQLKGLSVKWGLSVSQIIRTQIRQLLDNEPKQEKAQ